MSYGSQSINVIRVNASIIDRIRISIYLIVEAIGIAGGSRKTKKHIIIPTRLIEHSVCTLVHHSVNQIKSSYAVNNVAPCDLSH